MKKEFIETRNYERFVELVDSLLSSSLGVEMAAVIAPFGRGKSELAERVASENPQTKLLRFEDRFSLSGMIREIAFAVAGSRPRFTQDAVDIIQSEMARERKVIMMDEADSMPLRHLNQLRAFHDLHNIPIILLGEEVLYRKLSREGRLISRVRQVLELYPIGISEVVSFYRKSLERAVTPEQARLLLRHCEGDFRNLILDGVHVANFMKINGIPEVTDQIVNEVVKLPVKGRREKAGK